MAKAPRIQTQQQADALARRIWNELSDADRWELGDQFISGSFDWREWLTAKPSSRVLHALDYLRILWEQAQG
jgi:hypothetical protein